MVKILMALIFTIILCKIVSARFVTYNGLDETDLSEVISSSKEIEVLQWLETNIKTPRANELQCFLILLYTVYIEIIDLRDWLISVVDRVIALEELMETCERLPFEFLREQCRVTTETLQQVNLGLILLELQLKVDRFPSFLEGLTEDFQTCTGVIAQILSESSMQNHIKQNSHTVIVTAVDKISK